MKHSDIITKFKIEYDKAEYASSYPSLTDKEIATILDKAYLALMAQKVTGNNPRQAAFEADTKAIEDIRPLINRSIVPSDQNRATCTNDCVYILPDNFLYYIQSIIELGGKPNNVRLISHEDAMKFMHTTINLPWIDIPVCFIENNTIHVLIDPVKYKNAPRVLQVVFIKKPAKFWDSVTANSTNIVEFELNDTMAEELINLAIIMALENVESPRLSTKTQLRTLEA